MQKWHEKIYLFRFGKLGESEKAQTTLVYANAKSLKQAAKVQDEICETYRFDFSKYKPKTDINCLNAVFSTMAASVGKQIKYTGLAVDFTIPTVKKAYESLVQARIAKKVKALSNIRIPLEVYAFHQYGKPLTLPKKKDKGKTTTEKTIL